MSSKSSCWLMNKAEFIHKVFPVRDKLFRFAKRFLNDADAEDTVQETFVRLWNRAGELSEFQSIDGFAMVITRNLCLDRIKAKSYNTKALEDYNEPHAYDTPEKTTALNDEVKMVKHVIDQLPHLQRTVIQLRDIEGMEFHEMEEILKMKPNALRVNLSRARKAVREKLEKMHNYEYREH
jgi:RNA polymerase sigma factor (sigma-70 family)